jgi:hypothetical protein
MNSIQRVNLDDAGILSEIAHAPKARWDYGAAWMQEWRTDRDGSRVPCR